MADATGEVLSAFLAYYKCTPDGVVIVSEIDDDGRWTIYVERRTHGD